MNSIIQDILYKQAVVKYSYRNGVTKAAIKFKIHRKTIYSKLSSIEKCTTI